MRNGLVFSLVLAWSCLVLRIETTAQEKIPRIINGEPTTEFAPVGIVGSIARGGFCTGTLISSTYVLTAAHCAEVIESELSGTFQVGDQIYGTARILLHPDYDSRTLENDIALLELDEPVVDVEPSAIYRDVPLPGDELLIVGFGGTGDAESGSDGTFGTKSVGLTTIDEVTETTIIWVFDDPTESNTASGDSGGPGFIDVDGILYIASVTFAGTEPDSGLGDIAFNTRVDAYATWIDSTIVGSDDGGTDDGDADDGDDSTDDDQTEPDKVCSNSNHDGTSASFRPMNRHGSHRPNHWGGWGFHSFVGNRIRHGSIRDNRSALERPRGPAAGRRARRNR